MKWRDFCLAALLAGRVLAVRAVDNDVEEVVVNGILPAKDDTYRVDRTEVGPLGTESLLNTPYSISVVPVNLAENQQAQNVRELFRYIPSVQGENLRPQSRGLQAGVVQNTRIDGLNIAATTDYAVEQFDRVEVLNGLAGALYGPANPAGTFNYVFKRPTDQPLSAITLGYTSDANFLTHGDVSRLFGQNGWFGARVNVLAQEGETFADGSNLRRRLASGSFDISPAAGTHLEINASIYRYTTKGLPGTFAVAKGISFPDADTIDPKRGGYGYRWAGDNNLTQLGSARLSQSLGEDWELTTGVLIMSNDRASTVPTLTLKDAVGTYTATTATTTFSLDRVLSNTAAIHGNVRWLGTTNEIFVGTTGFSWNRYTPYQTGAITLGTATLSNPTVFSQPLLPDFKNRYHSQWTRQQSISIGDSIRFNKYVSIQLAASQSWIDAQNINKSATVTSSYDDDGISPEASIIVKPTPEMTGYITYANSLQQGDAAPAGAANAGEALAPYRSKQWEAGYKTDLSRVNLAFAVYEIRRPYAYVDANNAFTVGGLQRNRGAEVTVNGRIGENLNLFGGIALLDPKLLKTGNPATNDQQILGLPKLSLDLLAEYRLPVWQALTLSANINHVSRRPTNYTNTNFVGDYALLDMGARYQTSIGSHRLAVRLAINNLFDSRYWALIAPTSANGYDGIANTMGTLGTPRNVRLSLETAF